MDSPLPPPTIFQRPQKEGWYDPMEGVWIVVWFVIVRNWSRLEEARNAPFFQLAHGSSPLIPPQRLT